MEDIGGGVDYDGEINVNEPVIRAQPNDINNEYDTHPSEKDEHATHCDNCVHLSKCKRERLLRKSRPEEIPSSCPIVSCRFNCGWEFHECKSDEHDLLCSKAKVHCINKEYGCPFVLERRRRGQHLETCPASVVVCTMEWNRWPLPPGKNQPFEMNESKLDVAATLRDQKTISEWKECVPPSLRYLLKTYVNEKHPVMPLGVSGLRIPKSVLTKAQLEHEIGGGADISESTESEEHDESSDSPWGWKKSPPGLQESVCNKLRTFKLTQENPICEATTDVEEAQGTGTTLQPSSKAQVDNDNPNQTENDEEFYSCASSVLEQNTDDDSIESSAIHNNNNLEYQPLKLCGTDNEVSYQNGASSNNFKKKDVELSLTVEVRTKCQRKPDSMYTFMCSREFRRDEFPSHFSHIHSGIHTQLNGWLITRCPMANLGCSYGIERMYPFDSNHRIVFNKAVDAFCTTQANAEELGKVNIHHPNDKTDNERTMPLTSLPYELLVHLTKYLDPLSLSCLSMTNRLFRAICSDVITERGVVVLQWEKNENGTGWEITEKKWLFTTSFSPIPKWKFGDLGRVTNHLLTCPYFERSLPSKPFSYASVSPDQL